MTKWTDEEIGYLKDNYFEGDKEDLLLNLRNHNWNTIWGKAESLGLKRNIQKSRLSINEDFFKTWTKEMAYVFGYWIADGNMDKDRNRISFSSNDYDLLKMIKSILKSDHKIGKDSKRGFQLEIGDKTIYDDILKLGGIPTKYLTIQFPFVPDEYLPYFIRDFLDGDGGIYNYEHNKSASFTGNVDFLKVLKVKIMKNVNIDTNSFYMLSKNDPKRSHRTYHLGYFGQKKAKNTK